MFFLNQPVIQEFIKQEQVHRDIRILNPTITYLDPDKLLAKVKMLTYKDGPETSRRRSTEFSLQEFRDVLKSTGEGKKMSELTSEQRDLQRQVIHEFLKYRQLADHSLQEQLGFLTANMPRVNDVAIDTKNKRVIKAKNTSSLGLMKALEGKTFHSQILDYLNKAKDAKNEVTPITGHPALDNIVKTFADPEKRIKDDTRSEVTGKAVMSFIDYAIQVKATNPLNKYIKKVLVDAPTAAATQLAEVRKSMKGDLKDLFDNILGSLQPNFKINSRDVKNVNLVKRPISGVEADMLTEAFRTIRDNPNTNDLYKNLITASFLQSGTGNNRGSYHQYLPNEDVIKFMKPVIDRVLGDQMQSFNSTNAFYRNNYDSDDIVPGARMRTDPEHGYKYYDYYQHSGLDKLKEKITNAPKFLSLHSVYDAGRLNYPVIKAKETGINSKTGKMYTQAEKDIMAAMGDYSFRKVRLFQQVLDANGNKLETALDKEGNPSYLYKQINAWGDGSNAQEYYEQAQPSILDKHEKITELSDAEIRSAMGKGNEVAKVATLAEIKKEPVQPVSIKKENNKPENKPKPC
jgi:hypothetical protein